MVATLLSHPFLLVSVPFVICPVDTFALFLLLTRATPKEDVVDKCIFQECQEHEDEAAHEIDIDGFDVGDLGEGLTQMGVDGGHG